MLSAVERREARRIAEPRVAMHFSDLESAMVRLHQVRQSTGDPWLLWECNCGGWWVLPTPTPPEPKRGPCGSRVPWEGDDR